MAVVCQKGGFYMINQDKLKWMSQLALYEKKKSRKDLGIYSYDRDDYVRFEGLKTGILVTMALACVAALLVLWKMEWIIDHFDVINYKGLLLGGAAIYLCVMIFYLILNHRKSGEEYNQAHPRVRRYQRGLQKMKQIYEEEDRKQRQFEKGQWGNGQ